MARQFADTTSLVTVNSKKHCFRKHVDTVCENDRCSISDCKLRHPRKCKYFFQYKYCKFGQYCRFSHLEEKTKQYDKEVDILRFEIENIKKEIIEKDKKIKDKESEIFELLRKLGTLCDMEKQFKDKMEILENKINTIEKENKDLKIDIKELKAENESLTDQIAVNDMLHDSFKERMRDKYLYNTEDEESDYESDDEKREKRRELFRNRKYLDRMRINICNVCSFKAKNGTGLKTHIRMKHKDLMP